jgi:hypothetical protein
MRQEEKAMENKMKGTGREEGGGGGGKEKREK